MKLFISALFLFVIWNSAVIAGGDPSQDLLSCDLPACESIARETDYHYAKPEKSFTLKLDHFSLEIPDQPIKKIVISKVESMIFFEDGQVLYLSESTGPAIEGLSPETISRYPEIIFTKTKSDQSPTEEAEGLFWKMAIASKPFYFQGASEVTHSYRDSFSFYLTDSTELGFSARAMVTSSSSKGIFLVIDAKQMDIGDFKEIVYSVK